MADVDAQQTQSSCKIEFISIRKADRLKYLILFTAIYASNREFPTLGMNEPYKCPTPQNGQTHSNNGSATADELFECV